MNTFWSVDAFSLVELVVDAEMRPGDVVRVQEDRYGFPRVLGDQLLQPLRQLVFRRRDDAVGRLVSGRAVAVGGSREFLLELARLLSLVHSRTQVLAGVRAHVGEFAGDEQRLAVGEMLQHVALGQKVIGAVFTQDAVGQVIQQAQQEAAGRVGVGARQVGSGQAVAGPEEKRAQMVEAEARSRASQDTR